jgi:hypothetical protein
VVLPNFMEQIVQKWMNVSTIVISSNSESR